MSTPLPPTSALPQRVGFLGLIGCLVAVAIAWGGELSAPNSALLIVVLSAAPMWLHEWLRLRPSSGAPRSGDHLVPAHRFGIRFVGLIFAAAWYAALARVAHIVPNGAVSGFWDLLFELWFIPLALAGLYLAKVSTAQGDLDDFEAVGAWLIRLAQRRQVVVPSKRLWMTWLIKGFYLPLMISSVDYYASGVSAPGSKEQWLLTVFLIYNLMYLVDTTFAFIGYISTSPRLDAHVRSCEPTLLGWVAALICYPPFFGWLNEVGIDYRDGYSWYNWLPADSIILSVWTGLVILATGMYVWSTVTFGIRFSNLTHRGIITHGPYRWTKHPSYIAKNVAFWLIAIPFISPDGPVSAIHGCAGLLFVNAIYWMRARTEERHLSWDPVYREYAAWIAQYGAIARLKRLMAIAGGRRDPA